MFVIGGLIQASVFFIFLAEILDILKYWPEIYTTWQYTEGWHFVFDGGQYLAPGTVVCWYHCQRS